MRINSILICCSIVLCLAGFAKNSSAAGQDLSTTHSSVDNILYKNFYYEMHLESITNMLDLFEIPYHLSSFPRSLISFSSSQLESIQFHDKEWFVGRQWDKSFALRGTNPRLLERITLSTKIEGVDNVIEMISDLLIIMQDNRFTPCFMDYLNKTIALTYDTNELVDSLNHISYHILFFENETLQLSEVNLSTLNDMHEVLEKYSPKKRVVELSVYWFPDHFSCSISFTAFENRTLKVEDYLASMERKDF